MNLKNSLFASALLLAASAPAFSAPAVHAAPRPPVRQATQNAAQQVTLRATTDAARYTVGQPIAVSLAATNTSRRDAIVRFSSGQRFDFSVYKEGSRESSYTWSATKLFVQATASLRLRPGASRAFDAQVGDEMGALAPGRYRLVARLANTGRPVVARPISFEIVDLGLSITAKTDKASYKVGEPVRVDLSVANKLATANKIPFNSGQSFDVFIRDEAGNLVWSYGANLRFIQVLGSVTWQPKETKEYSAEWNGTPLPGEKPAPLQPGRYTVQALLSSAPNLYAAPVAIDITS